MNAVLPFAAVLVSCCVATYTNGTGSGPTAATGMSPADSLGEQTRDEIRTFGAILLATDTLDPAFEDPASREVMLQVLQEPDSSGFDEQVTEPDTVVGEKRGRVEDQAEQPRLQFQKTHLDSVPTPFHPDTCCLVGEQVGLPGPDDVRENGQREDEQVALDSLLMGLGLLCACSRTDTASNRSGTEAAQQEQPVRAQRTVVCIERHSKRYVFFCKHCHKQYQAKYRRNEHQLYCRENPDREQLICQFCDKSDFISERGHKQHEQWCPQNRHRIVHRCKYCDKEWLLFTDCEDHELSCERNRDRVLFCCDHCGKACSSRRKCSAHQGHCSKNPNRRQYSCRHCKTKKFGSSWGRCEHERTCAANPNPVFFYCQYCGKEFKSRSNGRVHERQCMEQAPNDI